MHPPPFVGFLQRYGCGDGLRVIRDSALLAGTLYGGGRTALRQALREHTSGGRHVMVATLKGSSSLPIFNSTLHALLKTGKVVVGAVTGLCAVGLRPAVLIKHPQHWSPPSLNRQLGCFLSTASCLAHSPSDGAPSR